MIYSFAADRIPVGLIWEHWKSSAGDRQETVQVPAGGEVSSKGMLVQDMVTGSNSKMSFKLLPTTNYAATILPFFESLAMSLSTTRHASTRIDRMFFVTLVNSSYQPC